MIRFLVYFENLVLSVSCAALFTMGLIVTGSVVGRTVFNYPIPDDLLLIGLLMVCVIVLPLAYVERKDGHIAVTVISDLFPLRVQAFLTACGSLLFGLFLGTMGFMIAKKIPAEMAQNLYYDGQLDIATWPMKVVFAVGVMGFLFRLSINIFKNLKLVLWPSQRSN